MADDDSPGLLDWSILGLAVVLILASVINPFGGAGEGFYEMVAIGLVTGHLFAGDFENTVHALLVGGGFVGGGLVLGLGRALSHPLADPVTLATLTFQNGVLELVGIGAWAVTLGGATAYQARS